MTDHNNEKPTSTVAPKAPLTPAEEIWNDIRSLNISMFALPVRQVSDMCQFVPIEPSKCFLTYSPSSFLPALESVIGDKYTLEVMNQYIVLSKKSVLGGK